MEKRVSLADISRDTGFSISAVSMALRKHVKIPVATRQLIEESARKLAYRPNPLIAALATRHFSSERTGKTPLAYIHVPSADLGDMAAPARIKVQEEYGRKLGYWLETFDVTSFKDGAQATRILFSRGFQGIILQRHFQLNLLPGMDWNRFCVVEWGESSADPVATTEQLPYRATVDHFNSIVRTWDEAWKRGYKRIGFGFLPLSEKEPEDDLRWGAAQSCLRRVPRRFRIPPLILHRIDWKDSRIVADWARRHRLDAVIGFNTFFLWALKTEGFRIPDEIGFATLHSVPSAEGAEYDFGEAGMKDMRLEIMLVALDVMDQMVRHHQYGLFKEPRTVMIQSKWIEGVTLPIRVQPPRK
jgi:LacI family transcriptional regulator